MKKSLTILILSIISAVCLFGGCSRGQTGGGDPSAQAQSYFAEI